MNCHKHKKVLFVFAWFFITFWCEAEEQHTAKEASMNHPVITVVFDNNPYKKGLQGGWGFSCLIEGMEKTVLFDTGADGHILLDNMQRQGIAPETIDIIIVLSHAHLDHIGGVYDLLQKNSKLTLYVPASFPESFKDQVKRYGAPAIEVKKPMEILKGVFSTGEMDGWIEEQSLIIRTPKGMVIVTGCAHPGIVNIVKRAKEILDDEVLLVMGGFHLKSKSKEEIKMIISEIQKLGVRYVGPCHCSGDKARDLFQEAYGEHYIPVGVGKRIDIQELK
ncbi:MAG: MBL fold metallo-hydrolase [Sulfurovum sp.]|nr:MBL fold metallo-hydrolase [Sulfurovum sp.]MDD3603127.1 MBL fold metallo-hydrolase [Sulfurovum sp.]